MKNTFHHFLLFQDLQTFLVENGTAPEVVFMIDRGPILREALFEFDLVLEFQVVLKRCFRKHSRFPETIFHVQILPKFKFLEKNEIKWFKTYMRRRFDFDVGQSEFAEFEQVLVVLRIVLAFQLEQLQFAILSIAQRLLSGNSSWKIDKGRGLKIENCKIRV